MKKLIIVAHGIGNHQPGFYEEWEAVIRTNTQGDYEVAGLWWEDVLDKVAQKYPLIDQNFANAVTSFGFRELSNVLNSNDYLTISDFFMDVLVYTAMGDMTDYIQTSCALKLKQLIAEKNYAPDNVILVGHSLGAAMLPHIIWRERNATGGIPYGGLILLASPLGMESPTPALVKDLLALTPDPAAADRQTMLQLFAAEWELNGSHLLHWLINTTDIVCADVQISVGPVMKDFIPIRQGFSDAEVQSLQNGNPGCVHRFTAGSTDVSKVIANHDVLRYLNRPEFSIALQGLLS
jgi:hypothetical protein